MRAPALFLSLLIATPAWAQGTREYEADEEFVTERVHADLPLYTFDWEQLWPRGMTGENIIAGCESRVRFGDWIMQPNPADEHADGPEWYRFTNYGAFHCSAGIVFADEREELEKGNASTGFFALIGMTADGSRELWALQRGFIPGSDYLLLARKPDADIVTRFDVLQLRCPPGHWRALADPDALDIMRTGYCAINSQDDLLALARAMAALPPLGTLEWHAGPEDSSPDPAEMSGDVMSD
ncbi:hypothetical protein [Aurantiacibacter spongiae]|uniref:Uncharacterized protein n=1 Tax=Aurantiacibacter spongiae TaxID=2488860 RepID=A0A3N5CS65_9SPHN|nr:hypothetical protein [Aurantiacibacter spongiae]RPF71964.1 hypothetical protein EG799_10325 [Aurantiacibacter spongiae]